MPRGTASTTSAAGTCSWTPIRYRPITAAGIPSIASRAGHACPEADLVQSSQPQAGAGNLIDIVPICASRASLWTACQYASRRRTPSPDTMPLTAAEATTRADSRARAPFADKNSANAGLTCSPQHQAKIRHRRRPSRWTRTAPTAGADSWSGLQVSRSACAYNCYPARSKPERPARFRPPSPCADRFYRPPGSAALRVYRPLHRNQAPNRERAMRHFPPRPSRTRMHAGFENSSPFAHSRPQGTKLWIAPSAAICPAGTTASGGGRRGLGNLEPGP